MKKKYIFEHWGTTERQTVYANGTRLYLQGYDFDGDLTKLNVYPKEIDSLIHALITLKHRL